LEKNGYKKISPHPAGEKLAAGIVVKFYVDEMMLHYDKITTQK
jgi:hypothetical protein